MNVSTITRKRLATAGFGIAGVLLFLGLGLPLPFLLGPMFLCLLASLGGAELENMGKLGFAFRTILGVAAGSSITPDVVSALPSIANTLWLVPIYIIAVAFLSYPMMRKVFGFDRATSYYCAMPGGLQDLVIFGEAANANMRVLSLVHATRVLLIVVFAPLILNLFWNVDLLARPGNPSSETPPIQILIMVFAGLAGWAVAVRLKILGASIIGPMILTAILSYSGIITQRPPAEMIWASQFFIGIAVGSKYVGVTLRELRKVVAAGLVNGLLLAVVSFIFILTISKTSLAPTLEAFLAFLPGGQGEMVVLAIIAGADLTFVVVHHILRITLVVLLAPLVFRMFR